MKIYTKTGDNGDTSLFGGGRVSKAHIRVEAYGSVDELNAVVGAAREVVGEEADGRLELIQHDLFAMGAHLATPPLEEGRKGPVLPALPKGRVSEMEAWIDAADQELPPLRQFILPGGSPSSAALHLARTVCRRAERRVTELAATDTVAPEVIQYLNRLSDLLFVMARLANARGGEGDIEWRG